MEIIMLTVGQVCTNCYIIHQEGTNSCVVIDPGDEAKKIADQIRKNGWDCEGILLTHGHFDHITGVSDLVSYVGGKVYAYRLLISYRTSITRKTNALFRMLRCMK